jgi:hypothetical protein
MSEQTKQQITAWLNQAPKIQGALMCGVRFADETLASDSDSQDFSVGAIEQAWRSIADTFRVLAAQQLPPTRLTWTHERAVLHCARRADGAILGVVIMKQQADADAELVKRLLEEFQSLQV